MKKLYEKNELYFALVWIGAYVVLASVGDNASASIGIAKVITAPICVVLAAGMYLWISRQGVREKYGLCVWKGSAKEYLYFLPLVLLATTNIWFGVRLNLTVSESVLYVVSMLCIGCLEEVLFRGFLFKALCKDNLKTAVIVSSVTFGFGHIVNLLNGHEVMETLLQVCYAVAIGFVFTILFYRSKSLWPCIVAHGVINSLSAFANEAAAPSWHSIVGSAFLIVVSGAYAVFLVNKANIS